MIFPTEKIIEKTLDILAKNAPKLLKHLLTDNSMNDLSDAIDSHLVEVNNWSSRIQLFGLGLNKHTDHDSISLKMLSTPRKFRSSLNTLKKVEEDAFLKDNEHYLLLGDPGSGKTTTLKRIIRLLLTQEALHSDDYYQYPILIRLKSYAKSSLFVAIADILGLKYKTKVKSVAISGRSSKIETQVIGDEPLEVALSRFLNETKAVLFLDGLDEVKAEYMNKLYDDISSLSTKLKSSKMIISCRSGEYKRSIEGFNTYEICPLTEEQIRAISELWLKDSAEFLCQVSRMPHQDIVTRPLILCQLITIFMNDGALPEKPCHIYRRITYLFLREWDYQKDVRRSSRYSKFDTDTKLEFLSELSFLLTYITKTKRFSDEQLSGCYATLASSFHLPQHEAKEVVNEIETHTGLLVESGYGCFEFSHLSLQEYLCANYLVREPFCELIGQYLQEYPAPIALAVAMASNPAHWFANLILKPHNYAKLKKDELAILLHRLYLEKPSFKVDTLLGLATIRILQDNKDMFRSAEFEKKLSEFVSLKGVRESSAYVLTEFYELEKADAENMSFIRKLDIQNAEECTVPYKLFISTADFNSLTSPQGIPFL